MSALPGTRLSGARLQVRKCFRSDLAAQLRSLHWQGERVEVPGGADPRRIFRRQRAVDGDPRRRQSEVAVPQALEHVADVVSNPGQVPAAVAGRVPQDARQGDRHVVVPGLSPQP